jgi:hypothetical protein
MIVVFALSACGGETGIHGTVTDANGKPVARAEVKLTEQSDPNNVIATTSTGSDGKYKLSNPKPGNYALTITWLNPGRCQTSGGPLSRSGEFLVALAQRGDSSSVTFGVSDGVKVSGENSSITLDLKFGQCEP